MMIAALVVAALVSVTYRTSFTVLADPDRLPDALRSRLDVVGPATFAAIVAVQLPPAADAGTEGLPTLVGLGVAALVATRTRNHAITIAVALAAATLVGLATP